MAKEFSQFGAEAGHLEQASIDRFIDARVLLEAGRTASAIVMAIYALEIRLKVNVCKKLELDKLPLGFQIHSLTELLMLAGLKKRLERLDYLRVKPNWEFIASSYGESVINDLRYGNHRPVERRHAADILNRIGHPDPGEGLLKWVSMQT